MPRPILITLALLAATTLAVAVATAQPVSQSPLVGMPPDKGMARAGACVFPAGGWATVNPDTVTHAASSALTAWSRYVLQCTTDTYFATGVSTVAADSGDGYVPAGSWLEFVIVPEALHFSVLNVSVDGTCKVIECR